MRRARATPESIGLGEPMRGRRAGIQVVRFMEAAPLIGNGGARVPHPEGTAFVMSGTEGVTTIVGGRRVLLPYGLSGSVGERQELDGAVAGEHASDLVAGV